MTTPGPGERVCPYCAEVVKAAAVKCRYCHSDLPPLEPDPLVPLDLGPEPVEEELPAATREPERAVDGGAVAVTGFRSWDRVAVVLGVLCALLLALLTWQVLRARSDDLGTANGQVTSGSYRDEAMNAAVENVSTLLGYSYLTLDADEQKAAAVLDPAYAEEYTKAMATLGPAAVREKKVRSVSVPSFGLVSIKKNTADVLVFADVTDSVDGQVVAADTKRILVSMTRANGRWVISKTDDLLIN